MASGSRGHKSFRRAIQAMIKDSTSVGIATVNSEYKTINISILKATNHAEYLPKEKHVKIILEAVSGSRPRADVAYCIHALKKRLAKTHSWVVALKTLIVIHRALREVDNSFLEELSFHGQHRGRMLNLLHFRDDSSPSAYDCSSWIRPYALYIEECLQCYRALKYDFYRDHTRTKNLDTPALLAQLPALQQLLLRLLCCRPVGAARFNYMIQYTLSIVAAESVRLYVAITDGVLVLVDKFFEMQRGEAVPALEIYRRAVEQAQRLSDFFEMCRSLEFGQTQKYVKIEQPPASFLTTMEGYINDAPQPLMLPWTSNDDDSVPPKLIAIPDPNKAASEEGSVSSDDCEETNKSKVDPSLIPDLLSWDEPCQEDSESMAAPDEPSDTTVDSQVSSKTTGWELAIATAPTPDAAPPALCKGGVLNRSVLDNLYETAATKSSTNGACQTPNASSNPFEADECVYGQNKFHSGYNHMLYPPSLVAHQSFIQLAETYQQPATFMPQQGNQSRSMVYDYMQQPRFTETNNHLQGSSFHIDVSKHISEMHLTEVPVQQREEPAVGNHSTGSFANPFM